MSPGVERIVRIAILGWSETFRLCMIVVVVVATTTICLYYTKVQVVPFFAR